MPAPKIVEAIRHNPDNHQATFNAFGNTLTGCIFMSRSLKSFFQIKNSAVLRKVRKPTITLTSFRKEKSSGGKMFAIIFLKFKLF